MEEPAPPLPPSPPFIHVDGIENFRDIGGYTTTHSPSQSIRRHFIYRCADPNAATQTGKARLTTLGITTIYDLRSQDEVTRSVLGAPLQIPGIKRYYTPVFSHQNASPEDLAARYKDYLHGGAAGFARAYRDILLSGTTAYRTIFLHLRDRPTDPLIFHCSAGKDRTGVLTMLILKVAGCEDEVVAREYQLTESGMVRLRPLIIRHILNHPLLQGIDEQAALKMAGAREEYMIATLAMVREEFGGVEGYLLERCELMREDLEKVKTNLLVESAPMLQSNVV